MKAVYITFNCLLCNFFLVLVSITVHSEEMKECKLPTYERTPSGAIQKQTDELKALALCVSLALLVMDPVHVVHAMSESIDHVKTEAELNPEFARVAVGMVNAVRKVTKKSNKPDGKIIKGAEKFLMGAATFAAKSVAVTVALECDDVLRHAFDRGETYKDRIIRINKTIDGQQSGLVGYLKGVVRHQWIVAAQGFEWAVCHGFDFNAAKNAFSGNDQDFISKLEYGEDCEWGGDEQKCREWVASGYPEEKDSD